MIELDRIDKIFDFAISREEDSLKFYMDQVKHTKDSELIEIDDRLKDRSIRRQENLLNLTRPG